jgi:hypothetical protein
LSWGEFWIVPLPWVAGGGVIELPITSVLCVTTVCGIAPADKVVTDRVRRQPPTSVTRGAGLLPLLSHPQTVNRVASKVRRRPFGACLFAGNMADLLHISAFILNFDKLITNYVKICQ